MYKMYLLVDFSSFACRDTVSYYDTTLTSLFINCRVMLDFCQHDMNDAMIPIVTDPAKCQRNLEPCNCKCA
jgi:hypothetical protein